MKNKNVLIFFGVLLFVLFVLLIIIVKDRNSAKVIVMPGNNVFTISNGRFIKYQKNIDKKMNIKVLLDDRKLSFTYIDGKIKFYEGKKEVEVIDDFKYAYTSGINIESLDFDTFDLNESELNKLNTILKNHNINGYDNLYTSKVVFNNQTIYFATNLFEEYTYDKVFSFVYYFNEDSDIIYLIEKIEPVDKTFNLCLPYVSSVVKTQDKINYVINCEFFSEIGTDIYFYEFKNGNIKNN